MFDTDNDDNDNNDTDTDDTEFQLQVLKLMHVLHKHGIETVHMGGLARILGVDDTTAAEFDNKVLVLDEEFAKYIGDMVSPGDSTQTLH
jgi:hypothetical protein